MLSEISQRKTNTACFHLCVESKKKKKQQNKQTNKTRQKKTHGYRE